MPTQKEDWRERFDEKYISIYGTLYDAKSAKLKSFIEALLTEQREEIREEASLRNNFRQAKIDGKDAFIALLQTKEK